jgi:DNA-binding PucR family transcriptional regulator
VVPDPDAPGRRARLASALAGLGAVVSGSVPLTSLPAVLPVATEALRLHAQGVLPADPVFLDEHYDALIVHHDARLLRLLEEQVLAPLAGVPAGARARLVDTLAAWLATMGDRQEMARELHVHPQTVRYRMGRLRELFGPSLDDPRTRARLLLVLGWRPATRALVSGATAPEPA